LQIVHMLPLVSSLSASDRTICIVDLLIMSGLNSKNVEEFNFM